MNRKFYNRRLKPGVERGGRTRSAISLTKATDVLKEAENAWWGLSEVRKKAARSQMDLKINGAILLLIQQVGRK